MSMATTATNDLRSGDVIELGAGDEAVTALVLLVSDGKVILDRCDETCPVVVELTDLGDFRIFRPELLTAVAA